MAVSDDKIIEAYRRFERAKVSGNSEERNKAKKEYHDLIGQTVDEIWRSVQVNFVLAAPRMSIDELNDALRNPVVSDLAKAELKRRARVQAREKSEQAKRDRTNEYRANLIQLSEIIKIINLIVKTGKTKNIDLHESTSNNKSYHISLVNTEESVQFTVMISSRKIFQIAIAFNSCEYYEGFYDPERTVQNTTFSICFSELGKHMYFVGKTNTSRDSLVDLTTDQLIKELTPRSINNANLSWDYVSKNKDIMPTQSDLQSIHCILTEKIATYQK